MSRLLSAVLAGSLVLLGACSDGEGDGAGLPTGTSAIAAVRAAPDAVEAAGSGRFEMTVAFTTSSGPVELAASGGFAGARVALSVDLASALDGLGGLAGSLPGGFEEPMQVVIDGDAVYLKVPILAALVGEGWLGATAEELGQAGDAFGLGGVTSSPTRLLELLRGAVEDPEEVGTEEVRGVATRHLRAVLDLDAALAAVPAGSRAALEGQLEGLVGEQRTVPVEVWLDGDGQVRRLRMDASDPTGTLADGGGPVVLTLELFDYGEPVAVEVPDPSDVTPITEVLGAFGGALAGSGR